MSKKIYIITNSHMDPIWLWRLREGRSTWVNTCRTAVKMLQKYSFLTFTRSSSACYRWIEETDPELFRAIAKLVEAGRWEPVGGWIEQSDTIITPAESLLRQAEHGKAYFRERFGKDIKVAYSVDSFGQNAGMPKILRATGFDYYAWMRPMEHEKTMPDQFRWAADDGSGSIVSFRVKQSYCTPPVVNSAEEMREFFRHVADRGAEHQSFFFGVGDHGGGIYEQHLQWLLEALRDYDAEFTTLESYFQVLAQQELPLLSGEHVHHAPGCYSAVNEIKRTVADTEKLLFKAEKIVLENRFDDTRAAVAELQQSWETFLFSYFHDIYPGTCSHASYANEIRDITGTAARSARDILERSLCRLGNELPTDFLTEGGVLIWNPLPYPAAGRVRFDTFADPNGHGRNFNCLIDRDGHEIPLQWLRAAASYGPCGAPWGNAVAALPLPASGTAVYAYGYTEQPQPALGCERQRELLKQLRFDILDDPNDTWAHGAKRLGKTAGHAVLYEVEELADGPVVSQLRAHYSWKNSSFQLDLLAYCGIDAVEAHWHGNWNEPEQTLKLCRTLPEAGDAILSGQAGCVLARTPDDCEQPFIDWVGVRCGTHCSGYFSHGMHSYDSFGANDLRLTICRPVIYLEFEAFPPHGDEGYADLGWGERSFWLFDAPAEAVPRLAQCCLWGPEHWEITAAGDGSRLQRDIWEVSPETVIATAQKRNPDGSVAFHLWNSAAAPCRAEIRRNGETVWHETMPGGAIVMPQL